MAIFATLDLMFKEKTMRNQIYSKMFMWLFVGLLVTFVTGIYTATNDSALNVIFGKGAYIFLVLAELFVAIFLSARIRKMQPSTAKFLYLLYAFLTGLTFSSLFIVYKLTSIILVFGVSALLFLIFALIGRYSKLDLSRLGTYLLMILFGIIICSIVNVFIGNTTFDIVICIISIVVFLGYIAYDVKKIERLEGLLEEDNLAILGAFELYLDFINVFIDLLRLFGNSRD